MPLHAVTGVDRVRLLVGGESLVRVVVVGGRRDVATDVVVGVVVAAWQW